MTDDISIVRPNSDQGDPTGTAELLDNVGQKLTRAAARLRGDRKRPGVDQIASTVRLPFVVQLADNSGFDFGGENGGIAAFANLGDAYGYAAAKRDDLGRELRVIGHRGRELYRLRAQTEGA